MTEPVTAVVPPAVGAGQRPLPTRLVLGGYSVRPEGDDPDAGTGLRVLDLDPGQSANQIASTTGDEEGDGDGNANGNENARAVPAPYVTVGHENLLSPTWVVQHPRRPWLVSVGESAPSELVCTRLEADGGLTFLSRWATTGDFGCHLALSDEGRQVVVAHYGSGTVESFALDEEGRFTGPLDRYVSDAPLGPDSERQDGPHAHQVVFDPARGELLVCDLGTDRVHRLHLAADGRLTEAAPAVELPSGSGPRHLVLAGDTMVVACELSVELWVAQRDGNGWRATQAVPTTTRTRAEQARAEAPVLPSEIRVAGEQVVVATRGVDTVSVFELDAARGDVGFVGEVSCGGHHPRDLVVADGRIWVANQWSDEVVVLDLAAVAAGREEEPVARIPSPRPACVVLTGTETG